MMLTVLLVGLAASLVAPGPRGREARFLQISLLLSVPVIMTLQHVLPFGRVFVPLFPLCFAVAAVGLQSIFERLPGQARSQWKRKANRESPNTK